jgi:hypothetical protein
VSYHVQVGASGYRLLVDGGVVEATEATRGGDGIRAVVALCNGAGQDKTLLHRDRINLSSAGSRARFLKAVDTAPVKVTDPMLLAVEEAIRQHPRGPRVASARPEGEPSPTRTVPKTLEELERRIRERLLINDADAVPVTLGVLAAHALPGDPPSMMIVGPPAGAKSELVMLAQRLVGVYFLSELTSRTFASGLITTGPDPSLLAA